MEGLSIIIPVYNEENAILSTIEQIEKIMSESGIRHEIIVINDGSTDNTGKILKENNKVYKLIEHTHNKGYGASLKTGISEARYDSISITDADATYPNERIPEFYHELVKNNYNMIVGKRSFKKLPPITKPAKWVINRLANYLASYKIPDINSGLRVFRKADAKRFFNIIPDGFSFTTTITLAMLTNNLRVKYIPIDYMKREGKSKIRPIYDTLNFMQLIVRTILYFNPLKIFIPLSLILILISLVILIVSWIFFPKILDATVTIFFISGIQMLAIGMIADMIDKRMNM